MQLHTIVSQEACDWRETRRELPVEIRSCGTSSSFFSSCCGCYCRKQREREEEEAAARHRHVPQLAADRLVRKRQLGDVLQQVFAQDELVDVL